MLCIVSVAVHVALDAENALPKIDNSEAYSQTLITIRFLGKLRRHTRDALVTIVLSPPLPHLAAVVYSLAIHNSRTTVIVASERFPLEDPTANGTSSRLPRRCVPSTREGPSGSAELRDREVDKPMRGVLQCSLYANWHIS